MSKMRKENGDQGVREAFNGLFVGLGMMIIVFLIAHFFLGMPILQ